MRIIRLDIGTMFKLSRFRMQVRIGDDPKMRRPDGDLCPASKLGRSTELFVQFAAGHQPPVGSYPLPKLRTGLRFFSAKSLANAISVKDRAP